MNALNQLTDIYNWKFSRTQNEKGQRSNEEGEWIGDAPMNPELIKEAAQDLARITDENIELKRLLIEQVGEHGWTNGGDYPDFCGTCENTAKQGHKADCRLAAALKQSS